MTNEANIKYVYACGENYIARVIVKFISDMNNSKIALLSNT